MTRTCCGGCSGSVKKYGAPTRHGPFLDQVIYCPKPECGWCGVETEDVGDMPEEEKQLEMVL